MSEKLKAYLIDKYCPSKIRLKDLKDCHMSDCNCTKCWEKAIEGLEEVHNDK